MSEQRQERCENCRFWDVTSLLNGEGICRRRILGIEANSTARWPSTRYNDWCGEFEAKPEAAPDAK